MTKPLIGMGACAVLLVAVIVMRITGCPPYDNGDDPCPPDTVVKIVTVHDTIPAPPDTIPRECPPCLPDTVWMPHGVDRDGAPFSGITVRKGVR